jgi:hypothetical protein
VTAKPADIKTVRPINVKCFEHDWTPWRPEGHPIGEAWERSTKLTEYRECTACDHYQERTA